AVRDMGAAGRGVERIVRAGVVVAAAFLLQWIEGAAERTRAVRPAIVGVHRVPVVTLLAGLDYTVAAPGAGIGCPDDLRAQPRGGLTGRPEDIDARGAGGTDEQAAG